MPDIPAPLLPRTGSFDIGGGAFTRTPTGFSTTGGGAPFSQGAFKEGDVIEVQNGGTSAGSFQVFKNGQLRGITDFTAGASGDFNKNLEAYRQKLTSLGVTPIKVQSNALADYRALATRQGFKGFAENINSSDLPGLLNQPQQEAPTDPNNVFAQRAAGTLPAQTFAGGKYIGTSPTAPENMTPEQRKAAGFDLGTPIPTATPAPGQPVETPTQAPTPIATPTAPPAGPEVQLPQAVAPVQAPPVNIPIESTQIPFKQDLSDAQKQSIVNLTRIRPVSAWNATDKANWAFATNNAPLPGNANQVAPGASGGVTSALATTQTTGTPTVPEDIVSSEERSFITRIQGLRKEFGLAEQDPKKTSVQQAVDDYKQVSESLGLPDIKASYNAAIKTFTDLQNEKNDKAAAINENPWLSEGVRVAQLRNLDNKYEGKLGNINSQIRLYESLYESGRQQTNSVIQTMHQNQARRQELGEGMLNMVIRNSEKEADAIKQVQLSQLKEKARSSSALILEIARLGGKTDVVDTKKDYEENLAAASAEISRIKRAGLVSGGRAGRGGGGIGVGGGTGGSALSGDTAKLYAITSTLPNDLARLTEKFKKIKGRTAIGEALLGTDPELSRLIDQISDKVGRLRSGGAINVDEAKRFKAQLIRKGDLLTGNLNAGLQALKDVELEANSITANLKGAPGGARIQAQGKVSGYQLPVVSNQIAGGLRTKYSY